MIKSPLATRKRTIDQEINELLPLSNAATDYLGRRYMKRITQKRSRDQTRTFHYRDYLQIAALDQKRAAHPALWYILWDPTEPVATRPLAIQTAGSWFVYGWDLTKNVMELYKSNGTIANSLLLRPLRRSHAKGQHHQSPSMEQRGVRRGIRACLLQLPPLYPP